MSAAEEWRPDVALLDIGLPGLSGFDVASRLRADPANDAAERFNQTLLLEWAYRRPYRSARRTAALRP